MKKLILTTSVVAIALVGFITILCLLPCNGGCCHKRDKCEMVGGDGKCSGDKMKCDGKEHRTEKVWTDADGKVHREVMITIGDGGMEGGCPMDQGKCGMGMEQGKCGMGVGQGKCDVGMEQGKCDMEKGMEMGGQCGMKMQGCCCCCMMMMNGHHMMGDSMPKSDSSVHVKIRGKL